MSQKIKYMYPHSGRLVTEDDSFINVGDLLRDGLRVAASPLRDAETVTPSDGADLVLIATYGPALMLYVSQVATVVIRKAKGGWQKFENLAPGEFKKMPPFVGVEATGTDTGIQIIAGY